MSNVHKKENNKYLKFFKIEKRKFYILYQDLNTTDLEVLNKLKNVFIQKLFKNTLLLKIILVSCFN